MLERADRHPTRFDVMIGVGYQFASGQPCHWPAPGAAPADAQPQSSHRTLLAAWRRLGSYISGKRATPRQTRFYIQDDNGRRYTWSEARHMLKCQGRI